MTQAIKALVKTKQETEKALAAVHDALATSLILEMDRAIPYPKWSVSSPMGATINIHSVPEGKTAEVEREAKRILLEGADGVLVKLRVTAGDRQPAPLGPWLEAEAHASHAAWLISCRVLERHAKVLAGLYPAFPARGCPSDEGLPFVEVFNVPEGMEEEVRDKALEVIREAEGEDSVTWVTVINEEDTREHYPDVLKTKEV